jgi:hypothetical protein
MSVHPIVREINRLGGKNPVPATTLMKRKRREPVVQRQPETHI